MTDCQYCGAAVQDMGDHFGGHKCEPCPDVLYAFGPDTRRQPAPVMPEPAVYKYTRVGADGRLCQAPNCGQGVYRRGRCYEHFRDEQKRYHRSERERRRVLAESAARCRARIEQQQGE